MPAYSALGDSELRRCLQRRGVDLDRIGAADETLQTVSTPSASVAARAPVAPGAAAVPSAPPPVKT